MLEQPSGMPDGQKRRGCTGTHFTVIRNTKQGIREQLETYLKEGVDHILALRGDFREAKPQQAEILTMPQIL